jgi:hypothetical protein
VHARGGRRVEILPKVWGTHDRGISSGMFLNDIICVLVTRGQAASEGPSARAAPVM